MTLFAFVFGLLGNLGHVYTAGAQFGEAVASMRIYDLQTIEVVDFRPETTNAFNFFGFTCQFVVEL